jgi:hypothetical protein
VDGYWKRDGEGNPSQVPARALRVEDFKDLDQSILDWENLPDSLWAK